VGHVLDFQGLPGADEADGVMAASAVSSVAWPITSISLMRDEGNPPAFG
jgi:hypothetical protein